MDDDEQLRRLRWQCRRGMLELDHLFSRFLELGYADLTPADRLLFTELLREQDQDLHNLLISRSELPEARYRELIEQIRAVASESGG
ncbi:succinate dehydrogenase assembly factor 2 [Thiorhodococcus minor]|uniref:FAD assembly factor SdhE n=2 Tax=Thiorhodococcus minor TaxID=57489 RepID=A0A6M0JVH0_9GAMM|nr:succinate dehydrogenase assembly factor 2 [Thiorhodococcus minor]NEV61179.1 succinate dehydrogenase assembly factor 2 [Thiorhodococcus minor]